MIWSKQVNKQEKKLLHKSRTFRGRTKGAMIAMTGLLVIALALADCSPGSSPAGTGTSQDELTGSFKIIGSNTVTPLSTVWAGEFMKMHPKVSIAVSGPGSGVGIAALIDSTTDICQSSRTITATEIDQAKATGVNPYEMQVARDGLSVVVHPSNPVSELTITQLSDIYTGKITNWKEVGGKDAPIVAISRDTKSGTHVLFKEHVVQMLGLPTADTKLEYGQKVLMLLSTEKGVSETAKNPNAIFYSGLGYVTSEVKLIGVKKTANDPAIRPSVETVLDGTYPVSGPLLFYTNGAPIGVIKAFVDYCLSPEGQKRVTEVMIWFI